jgi:hypothetical protein
LAFYQIYLHESKWSHRNGQETFLPQHIYIKLEKNTMHLKVALDAFRAECFLDKVRVNE